MRQEDAPGIKPVFGCPGGTFGDPKLNLLDQVLASISPEQRAVQISDGIVAFWQNPEIVELVDGLKKVMLDSGEHYTGYGVNYRTQLIDIYGRLPKTEKHGEYIDSDRDQWREFESEAAPPLKLKIIGEVMEGWRLISTPSDDTERWRYIEVPGPDANVCYQFICGTYKGAQHKGILQKGILTSLKNYLEPNTNYTPFKHDRLTPWILDPVTPPDFVSEMLQFQIRHGLAHSFLQELRARSKSDQQASA